ncbi:MULTISPECIES: hypothetical protein [Bacteroides]|uniref:hypothetical protein n=1 Tax=Bacteroides TaxID=816 RepID=UPI00126A3091|nr:MULTISPECIES: hypothetical protein [Bacteroides]KAB3902568.1 hypothetical protein GAS32_18690 [Bacteroides uniformis]
MGKYKYTKETLDIALDGLRSEDVAQRTKNAQFISMASRSELFGKTCDTLGVQAWFLSLGNREKLIKVLYQETEEKLLWEYLLILYMVCQRYIDHGCYIKDFAKEIPCVEFKQRTYEVAKQYAHYSSAIVRQISGSIIGYMGDNDVWEIFCNVMSKKRDLCTISHITMGIGRHCAEVNKGDSHLFGGTMTENQRMDLLNNLRLVYQKSSNKSIKGMCLRTIEELEKINEVRTLPINQ